MLRRRHASANSEPAMTVSLTDIRQARTRVRHQVIETPLIHSHSFSRICGRDVWLKAEALQRAGSFKIRGAANVISGLSGQAVVAASAGNHAQGVALAAANAGVPCTVFMPENAALPKIEATRDYGATVCLAGSNLAEAVEAALAHAAETGDRFIHPYDDPGIVAGQGTLGLELVEQLPDLGTVIVPTGGGGLLSGVAVAVKALRPEAKVVGVEIDAAPTYVESRRAGHPVAVPPRPTMADGINVTTPSSLAFELIERHVDDLVVVTEAQTSSALTLILERSKLMVEPAAAVGIAALVDGVVGSDIPEPVVVVLSGGNIDLLLLGKVVRHGLESSGRYADLRVWVPDQPGQLLRILQTIAAEEANVVQVEHHREGFGLPFGTVEITISIETRGPEHTARIRRALEPYAPDR